MHKLLEQNEEAKITKIVDDLHKDEALAEKVMTTNLYQRMYRNLFTEEAFKQSQRNVFAREILPIELYENKLLEWNKKPSPLYSQEKSLEFIKGRYENAITITHLTIEHLEKQSGYLEWLKNLKEQGWLDWQILMSIYNHILTYKANLMFSGKTFATDKIARDEFQKLFRAIRQMDENENYVQFPLDYFTGVEFQFQLDQTAHLVISTWGLENKASFPNFPALKDFLNHRFNFGVDDLPELSPL